MLFLRGIIKICIDFYENFKMKLMSIRSYDYSFDIEEDELLFIRNEFKKAFEIFESRNYPDDENTLMCSIHLSFEENGHNCVACNLEESAKLIVNFLKNYNQFNTAESVFPNFILLIYLMVERIDEYLNIMELQRSIREKKFKSFSTIKQWANFVKHPKAFMLVHHPTYIFEGFKIPGASCKFKRIEDYEIKIDSNFVKEFYSGSDKNKKLYDRLIKKENVLVVLPNPVKLMTEFCEAQKYFVELICGNQVFRDLLSEKATKYYEDIDMKEENKSPSIPQG